jgi:hypothetical protein
MSRERLVIVRKGFLLNLFGGLTYELAWVCASCSATFPIAIKGRLVGGPQPMFRDGEK